MSPFAKLRAGTKSGKGPYDGSGSELTGFQMRHGLNPGAGSHTNILENTVRANLDIIGEHHRSLKNAAWIYTHVLPALE
jgi:hypothetical protein